MAHRITIRREDVGSDTCVRAEESYIDIHGQEQWRTMMQWGSPLCRYADTQKDIDHVIRVLSQRIEQREIMERQTGPSIVDVPVSPEA